MSAKSTLSAVAVLLLAWIAFCVGYDAWLPRVRAARVVTVPDPAGYEVRTVPVSGGAASGTLLGRIFQHSFVQRGSTAGRSPSVLALQFERPADIYGVLVSVDCWKNTPLVEFAGGINQTPAYKVEGPEDMLFHVSHAAAGAGKIDEQIWFPQPFRVAPADRLNIGAWIQNISGGEASVSPEFIVYFKWAQNP